MTEEEPWEPGWQGPDDWGPRQYRLEGVGATVYANTVRAHARHVLEGRSRHNALVVLDVLCDLVEEHTISRVFCSQRDMCEKAGIGSRATVTRALVTLEDAELVRYAGTTGPGFGRCCLYDLVRPDTEGSMAWGLQDKHIDIWRNPPTGIGHNAHLVFDALCGGTTTIAEIVDATGLTRPTTYRVLARLHEKALAIHGPAGWVPGPVDPVAYGTTRYHEAVRTHRRQRTAFHKAVPDADLSQR